MIAINDIDVRAYRFPAPAPESDGTLDWDATVAVVVRLRAGDHEGLGWTYTSPAAEIVVRAHLADVVRGRPVFAIGEGHEAMRRACRNIGLRGLAAQAISAVDIAWWDLKARTLGCSLLDLLGAPHRPVPMYGSGGFVSMDDDALADQVGRWRSAGCASMKIKIGQSRGADIGRDLARVRRLRELAGPDAALMVDANGGYRLDAAVRVGRALDGLGVSWFEEPVTSDDVPGLRLLRDRLDCAVAAGEYIADAIEAARLIDALDVLQLDATRCGGYTGWLACAQLAQAASRPLSAHCAPALHAFVAGAAADLRHVEWFSDHVRVERLLIDGAPEARDGALHPRADVPGHGMTLAEGAEQYRLALR